MTVTEQRGTPQPSPEPPYVLVPLASVREANSKRTDGSSVVDIPRVPPPTLEAARAEGDRWLGALGYAGSAPAVFETATRASESECVDAGSEVLTRSRDWMLDRRQERQGDWLLIPADQGAFQSPAPVLLRARWLDGDATHVIEVDRARSELHASAAARRVPVDLPQRGGWVVVVTAQGLWGCFIVTVTEVMPARGTTVASVEAQGARAPYILPPAIPPSSFDRAFLQGGPERRCVPGGNSHTRSGEWVFDPLGYAADWDPARALAKTAWVPLHRPEAGGTPLPLLVKATLLQAPMHTYTYVGPAWVTGDAAVFYATASFGLPRAGEWILEASAGPNWGCFLVSVGQP